MKVAKVPRYLVNPTQRPIAGFGNYAANREDKDRGQLGAKYGRRFLQNIGPAAPSGHSQPALPLRHQGLVRAHSLSVEVAKYTGDPFPEPIETTFEPFELTLPTDGILFPGATELFFELNGTNALLADPGEIPPAGTLVGFEIVLDGPTTNVEVTYSVLKNGVLIDDQVIPGGGAPGTVTFAIAPTTFNGTTDVLTLRANFTPGEGEDPQNLHGTAFFEADAPVTSEVDVMVYTPSNRLRLAVYTVFEAGPNSNFAFVDGSDVEQFFGSTIPQWQIRAMSRNPRTNRESPLQLAYPAIGTTVPLPDSYEMDTAAKLLRVRLSLASTDFVVSAVPPFDANPATWRCLVYATWEPNVPVNSDEELNELYAACALTPNKTAELTFVPAP